jgi:hypothetical protein
MIIYRSSGDKMKKLSSEEWEKICRHCGKCCLIKLEDEDTGDIYYTDVVCQYFDEEKMCCSVYDRRCELVPTCLKLDKENVDKIQWMPRTCAYRELFEQQKNPIQTTIKGRVVSETVVSEEELEDHIVDWEDL